MKYLSAEKLQIEVWERAALIGLHKHLSEHGSAIPAPGRSVSFKPNSAVTRHEQAVGFAMQISTAVLASDEEETYHCGTVACIGGHVRLSKRRPELLAAFEVKLTAKDLTDADRYVASKRNHPILHDLYFPPQIDSWSHISPLTASVAIHTTLRKGRANWVKACLIGGQTHLLNEVARAELPK